MDRRSHGYRARCSWSVARCCQTRGSALVAGKTLWISTMPRRSEAEPRYLSAMKMTGWPGRSVPRATSTRSAAARAGFRREIDSQAGWIERRPVVEMAPPIIAIRRLTDERRAQTRDASARVRVLAERCNRSEPLPGQAASGSRSKVPQPANGGWLRAQWCAVPFWSAACDHKDSCSKKVTRNASTAR
jgi:hypothetical protein